MEHVYHATSKVNYGPKRQNVYKLTSKLIPFKMKSVPFSNKQCTIQHHEVCHSITKIRPLNNMQLQSNHNIAYIKREDTMFRYQYK